MMPRSRCSGPRGDGTIVASDAKSRTKRALNQLTAAFRELSGQDYLAHDAEPHVRAAWKVCVASIRAAADSAAVEQRAWLERAHKPLLASAGLLRSRVLPAVRALGSLSPENVRVVLAQFDRAYTLVSDDEVRRFAAAFQKSPWAALARLSLSVGAMGARREAGESDKAALRRIAGTFREASSPRKRAAHQVGVRTKR